MGFDNLFGKHDDLTSFLRAYHGLLAGQLCEGEEELYAMAKEAVGELQPTFEFGFERPPTAYELFLLIEGMTPRNDGPAATLEGFDPRPMDFSEWDPMRPVDDTEQYPDHATCPLTDRD
jgi:hypothetical protein